MYFTDILYLVFVFHWRIYVPYTRRWGNCKSLIKGKFFTDQARVARGSGGCLIGWLVVTMLEKSLLLLYFRQKPKTANNNTQGAPGRRSVMTISRWIQWRKKQYHQKLWNFPLIILKGNSPRKYIPWKTLMFRAGKSKSLIRWKRRKGGKRRIWLCN